MPNLEAFFFGSFACNLALSKCDSFYDGGFFVRMWGRNLSGVVLLNVSDSKSLMNTEPVITELIFLSSNLGMDN